jgi:GT2 family glycosyltransferase
MEKLSVIIPNYNGKGYLEDCLRSLRKQTFKDFDIILVDNGSEDGSLEYLDKKWPEVKVIALPENTGFANAVNVGIEASDSEYVFLLNNDTICDERALESLVRIMDNKRKLFSAQAKMLKIKDPHDIDDAGDLYCALGWAFALGKDTDNRRFSRRESITSACAGAAIYRKEYFETVGLFDSEHFCYLEDVDLGYRARLKGYGNVMEPEAIVYHVGSASSGSRYNKFKVELTAGNNLYLLYKNMPGFQLFINFPFILVGILVKHFFYLTKGLGTAHLKGLLKGMGKIAKNPHKRVRFRRTEIVNALRLQIELWVNMGRRFLGV